MNNRKRTPGRKFNYLTFIVKGEKPTIKHEKLRSSTVGTNVAKNLPSELIFKHSREAPNPNYIRTEMRSIY